MDMEMLLKLKRSLIKHEGRKEQIYADTKGKLTGGIGYNFTDRGLPEWFIERQFQEDIDYFYNQLMEFSWFRDLNADRKIILIDMSFMGIKKLLGFKKMIEALSKKDFTEASIEMLDSEWAKEVKGRARELAIGMLNGIYNI